MRPRKKSVPPPTPQPGIAAPRHRILLVEDNAFDAELCARQIAELGLGVSLETVPSRTAAEQALKRGTFDVVITDHQLPDGTSDDIVRLVRSHSPDIPCIVLTGVLDDRSAANVIGRGAFDYVQKDRAGRLAGAVQHALDTRRVRDAAATAVRTMEERQREIAGRLIRTLENMSDGFVALDRTDCYQYVNRRAGEMLGKRPDELIGTYAWTDFPEPGRLPLRRACDRALLEQQAVVIEEPFLLSARWLESRIVPALDGIGIFFRDVTERRQAVEALQASERRFRTVVEHAASGMIMVDRSGMMVFENRAVELLFGYESKELIGKPVELLIPERYRSAHPGHRASFASRPEARPMGAGRDLFGVHKEGREVPVEIGLTPLETEDGLAVLVTIVDITERKRGEAERDSLGRQLFDLQEGERRALANELHDEVGQLLTGLKLMLESHGTMGGPEEMSQLVREAMDRVRDVSMNLRPPMLDDLGLRPTLEWLAQRVETIAGIAVRLSHAGLDRRFPQSVETAAFRIAQEALTNVAKHAGVQSAELDVSVRGDRLVVSVRDRGTGFEPSARHSAGATQGVRGMRERARLLGGRFHMQSTPGGGTHVLVELPINPSGSGPPAH
jgi:PAS domain S-box-containing protein